MLPNFKLLGPKLGKLLPKVKQWLADAERRRAAGEHPRQRQDRPRDRRPGGRAHARRSRSPPPSQARLGRGERQGRRRRAGDRADAGADRRGPGPRLRPRRAGSPQGTGLRVHRPHRDRRRDASRPSCAAPSSSSAITSPPRRWPTKIVFEPIAGRRAGRRSRSASTKPTLYVRVVPMSDAGQAAAQARRAHLRLRPHAQELSRPRGRGPAAGRHSAGRLQHARRPAAWSTPARRAFRRPSSLAATSTPTRPTATPSSPPAAKRASTSSPWPAS